MDNHNILAQQNAPMMIAEKVSLASSVINQFYQWTEEEENFRKLAKKEAAEVKNAKSGKVILRLLSPFLALLIAFVSVSIIALSLNDLFNGIIENETGGIISVILMGVVYIVLIIGMWCYPFKAKEHQAKSEEYAQLAEDRTNSIDLLIDQYSDVITVIPEKYRYPLATNYIVELFQTGRATSLPVAFDKLEEQLHRWNLEAAMQEALAYQMCQTEALRKVRSNSAVSAAANTVSAVAHLVDLFT